MEDAHIIIILETHTKRRDLNDGKREGKQESVARQAIQLND